MIRGPVTSNKMDKPEKNEYVINSEIEELIKKSAVAEERVRILKAFEGSQNFPYYIWDIISEVILPK